MEVLPVLEAAVVVAAASMQAEAKIPSEPVWELVLVLLKLLIEPGRSGTKAAMGGGE